MIGVILKMRPTGGRSTNTDKEATRRGGFRQRHLTACGSHSTDNQGVCPGKPRTSAERIQFAHVDTRMCSLSAVLRRDCSCGYQVRNDWRRAGLTEVLGAAL